MVLKDFLTQARGGLLNRPGLATGKADVGCLDHHPAPRARPNPSPLFL